MGDINIQNNPTDRKGASGRGKEKTGAQLFRLPLFRAIALPSRYHVKGGHEMSAGRRLLIAEDDLEMRALLKKVLTREGFEVEIAANGREAMTFLQETGPFDLLLSDVRMPEKDGEQLLTEARALQPSLKVIMITSYGEFEQFNRLKEKGAYGYLTKPFKIPDLLDIIDRATAAP